MVDTPPSCHLSIVYFPVVSLSALTRSQRDWAGFHLQAEQIITLCCGVLRLVLAWLLEGLVLNKEEQGSHLNRVSVCSSFFAAGGDFGAACIPFCFLEECAGGCLFLVKGVTDTGGPGCNILWCMVRCWLGLTQ